MSENNVELPMRQLGENSINADPPFDLHAWADQLDFGAPSRSEDLRSMVFLITMSRVLETTITNGVPLRDPSTLTHEQIRAAVLDAFENPVASPQGGRPRSSSSGPVVCKMLIAREKHADGT